MGLAAPFCWPAYTSSVPGDFWSRVFSGVHGECAHQCFWLVFFLSLPENISYLRLYSAPTRTYVHLRSLLNTNVAALQSSERVPHIGLLCASLSPSDNCTFTSSLSLFFWFSSHSHFSFFRLPLPLGKAMSNLLRTTSPAVYDSVRRDMERDSPMR